MKPPSSKRPKITSVWRLLEALPIPVKSAPKNRGRQQRLNCEKTPGPLQKPVTLHYACERLQQLRVIGFQRAQPRQDFLPFAQSLEPCCAEYCLSSGSRL